MPQFRYVTGFAEPCAAFPEGHPIARPYLLVKARIGNEKSYDIKALVDTGSEFCIFPEYVLAEMGGDWSTLPSVTLDSARGDSDIHFASVMLWVEGLGELEVYAGFTPEWNSRKFGVLGYRGFLDRHKATFDPQAGIFEIEAYPIGMAKEPTTPIPDGTESDFRDLLDFACTTPAKPTSPPAPKDKPQSSSVPKAE